MRTAGDGERAADRSDDPGRLPTSSMEPMVGAMERQLK
jgi:hypothetical protein